MNPLEMPWIDEAQLKIVADKYIPVLIALDGFMPKAQEVNNLLEVVKAFADNDQIRKAVVASINGITGATGPGS